LPGPLVRREAKVAAEARELLADAVDRLALTGRGFDRAVKVARTIADLAGDDHVGSEHVVEALAYRATDPSHGLAHAG
jgi:magnesium chelatase family protein